jgi:glycosyltransferase involved in cell wall biosynthesis
MTSLEPMNREHPMRLSAAADSRGYAARSTPSLGIERLLWITPKWPLPATDGARQATTQLVSALCSKGAIVDLLAVVPEGETVSESDAIAGLGVRSAAVVRRPKPGRLLLLRNLLRRPLRALTLSQYATKQLAEAMSHAASQPGTVVVFDGLHSAAWVQEGASWPEQPVIYRAHNVEADLWFRGASQRRGLAARLLAWQGKAVERFEAELSARAQVVFTVSEADAVRFRELAPDANVETLPIGLDPKPEGAAPARDDQLLFVGRLDWPPNRDGLEWFLKRVWPHVTRPFVLNIVGSGDGSWLTPYRVDSRIRFHGEVPSVDPYYHSAIVNLVPIFYGSGTRVKAIESSLFATACLGTERGVEGLGLEPQTDYLRAESEIEWIESLNELDPETARQIGRNALARASERFDRDRIAAQFLKTLRTSLGQVRAIDAVT